MNKLTSAAATILCLAFILFMLAGIGSAAVSFAVAIATPNGKSLHEEVQEIKTAVHKFYYGKR